MVYGNFESAEVTEEHPLNPIGIYGALKLGGEKLVIAYQQVFGLSYTIVRPSALYGPRCVSRRVGQIFVEEALAGRPLKIEGDGEERLDFTYIDDLVNGLCLAIAHPGAKNQVFNMTYGAARSIADLVEVLKRQFPDVEVQHVPRDRLMPFRGTLNVDKARRLVGYEPAFPIDIGFEKYVEWYRRRPGGPTG
jgi:nucleoside-diphosphate-sugar epimerase